MKYSIALGSSKIAGSVHKTVKAHARRRPVRSSAHEPLQAQAQDNRIINSSRKFSKAHEHENSENQSQRSSHIIGNRLKKKKS